MLIVHDGLNPGAPPLYCGYRSAAGYITAPGGGGGTWEPDITTTSGQCQAASLTPTILRHQVRRSAAASCVKQGLSSLHSFITGVRNVPTAPFRLLPAFARTVVSIVCV